MKNIFIAFLLTLSGTNLLSQYDKKDLIVKKFWCNAGHFNWDQVELLKKICNIVNPLFGIETGFCTGRSSVPVLVYGNPKKFISIDINLDYMHQGRIYSTLLMKAFPAFLVIEANSNVALNDSFFNLNFPEGIDWATVDGDHTYEGCMHDLIMTSNFLRKNGIIIIDDYRASIPAVTKSVDDFCEKNKDFYKINWSKLNKETSVFKGCAILTKSKAICEKIQVALN